MTIEKLTSVYRSKGYEFDLRDNVVNLFGIRSKESQSDKFDDTLGLFVSIEGVKKLELFQATTDPGKSWLLTPMRKEGTAIMVPGQYRELYKLGRHKDYEALEQRANAKYVRDNNKDSKLDFSLYREGKGEIFSDNIKSNIHRASANKIVNFIGLYSAACQVVQNPKHFETILNYCKNQINHGWANLFTYTLLEISDFE